MSYTNFTSLLPNKKTRAKTQSAATKPFSSPVLADMAVHHCEAEKIKRRPNFDLASEATAWLASRNAIPGYSFKTLTCFSISSIKENNFQCLHAEEVPNVGDDLQSIRLNHNPQEIQIGGGCHFIGVIQSHIAASLHHTNAPDQGKYPLSKFRLCACCLLIHVNSSNCPVLLCVSLCTWDPMES